MSEKFKEMYEILMKDSIQIPKSLMAYDDIEDDTKILFSVVLDECIKAEKSKEQFVDELTNITLERIAYECLCTNTRAKLIKTELQELIPDVDDILYLNKTKE